MDAKLPPGLGGRMILPFSLWLMKRTMLGNPLIKPWEDVARLAGTIEMEQFMFGSWYICAATKPLTAPAPTATLTFQARAASLYPAPADGMPGAEHMSERAREQCWVINNEVVEPRPACAPPQEELVDKHHAFIHDLEAKGMLVGAGPFLDDTGARFGTGMIIFRCATRAEAEKIANSEPYIANGVRRLKLMPWQKIAGR